MRVAVGSDHRGDAAAAALLAHLDGCGHEIVVRAAGTGQASDYPDRAWAVAQAVSAGQADRGILLCGSATGMSIAANKVNGVRAAAASDGRSAESSRRHNDANVLCLSADRLTAPEILAITDLWLAAPFDGGRHARRVMKIEMIERGVDPGTAEEAGAGPR
jgi:ribose 5-phosphate isomerase B